MTVLLRSNSSSSSSRSSSISIYCCSRVVVVVVVVGRVVEVFVVIIVLEVTVVSVEGVQLVVVGIELSSTFSFFVSSYSSCSSISYSDNLFWPLKITDSNYSEITVNFAHQLQLSEINLNISMLIKFCFLKTVSNSVANC